MINVDRGNALNIMLSSYAYPFSFPVGKGTGQISATDMPPLTWGDLAYYPPYIIPTIALPIIALFIVWKGLN